MNKLPNVAVFGAAVGLGALLLIAATDLLAQQALPPLPSMQMTARIAVAGQLTPGQVEALREHGFDTVIAIQPRREEARCVAW